VALAISGADKVNAVGWCVGGTILSSALAVMRAQGDKSVASLTLLTTMLDFVEAGDLGVFIDEQGVSQREQSIGKGGIYPGAELGFVFQTLRANDLIWPYVINNYLKGKSPDAFDLLYRSGLNVSQALEKAGESEAEWSPEVREFFEFVRGAKKRGVCALMQQPGKGFRDGEESS
jgi:poly(3-hydroxyalkanoate) synthetase